MILAAICASAPAFAEHAFWVDATHGDDHADGSKAHPWKTIAHAVDHRHPGDTVYLHGGTYFEAVTLTATGTADAPITLRSAPGEHAIIDAGLREFEEHPASAWEPVAKGSRGEFQSTRTYSIDKAADQGRGVWVLGNIASSMIPLHGYRFASDFHSDNPYWTFTDNVSPTDAIYLGPGVWFDWESHRIHARLVADAQRDLPHYTGETDPRLVPLVIGIDRSALRLASAKHVRVRDLVLRGSAVRTVQIEASSDVVLDGVTIYGGAPALWIKSTDHFRLLHASVRGLAAPWSTRASMKYRGISPYLVVADSTAPRSQDWEIASSEFRDGHDGIVIDSVKRLRFHNNRIENLNDDAIYLALPPRVSPPDDVQIFENVVSRVYTVFAFASAGKDPNTIGSGVHVYRNIFDLRDDIHEWIAKDATAPIEAAHGRMCGDHGSPTWEPLFFYLNTVIYAGPPPRPTYGEQLTMGMRGTQRRVLDNIIVELDGNVGSKRPAKAADVVLDGNLFWGPHSTAPAHLPGGHDRFADPKFENLAGRDVRLQRGSPAIDAGVPLPAGWPDSRRAQDRGLPDVGALPVGASPPAVGPDTANL